MDHEKLGGAIQPQHASDASSTFTGEAVQRLAWLNFVLLAGRQHTAGSGAKNMPCIALLEWLWLWQP
jgi:hypothetical protein